MQPPSFSSGRDAVVADRKQPLDMGTSAARLVAVQLVTLLRLAGAVIFSAIAFEAYPVWLVVGVYLIASLSDVLDGFLARRLSASSVFGRTLDLISDKSLTVISLLYAAARGIALLPLALIAARELLSVGLRLITVDGKPLLPTSRLFSGAMAVLLWGNTAFLVVLGSDPKISSTVNSIYWICAAIFAANLGSRLVVSRKRIIAALVADSERN